MDIPIAARSARGSSLPGLWRFRVPPNPPRQTAADKAKAFAALPDWSGIWMGVGQRSSKKAGAASLNANIPMRRIFPYRPAWEAAYTAFLITMW